MARATAVVDKQRWRGWKAKGNGEGGKSDRDGKKRALLRAARAMATATRVAGEEEDEGVEEGNESFYF
jgi:hypothetical protein